MKTALLKFGPFKMFLDVADERPTIYVPHPLGTLRVSDHDYGAISSTADTKKLEFAFKRKEYLEDTEVLIYEFEGVS